MALVLAEAVLLAAGAACAVAVPGLLDRSRWAWAHPRAALGAWACWLSVSAATALAALTVATQLAERAVRALPGAPASTAPWAQPCGRAAVVVLVVVASARAGALAVGLERRRRRHAAVVELVGAWDPRWEVLVVPSPVPAAYAVAGSPPGGAVDRRCTVVLTSAAMSITDEAERRAITLHHRARTSWHLDTAVLLFTVWRDLLPRWRGTRTALEDVATLAAMLADRASARAVGTAAAIGAMRRLEVGLPGSCDDDAWTPRPATARRVRHLLRCSAPGPAEAGVP